MLFMCNLVTVISALTGLQECANAETYVIQLVAQSALLDACEFQLQLCPASREAKVRQQQALLACPVSSLKVDRPYRFDAHSGCLPLQGLTYQRHETLWRYCGHFLRQGMRYLSSSFLFGCASPHFPAPLCSIHAFHCNPYSA